MIQYIRGEILNVFKLDEDLETNARYMVDKHVVKMPTESAQLLCTALHFCGQEAPYKATYINHPSSIWCRQSLENWLYLREIALNICKEYTYRYGKVHKAEIIIRSLQEPNLPKSGLTKLPNCMDKSYIVGDNVVENYRNYYNLGKSHLHSWKGREKPTWIKNCT
jgi:lipopolysaccharide biosynthesis glycosyltransferase